MFISSINFRLLDVVLIPYEELLTGILFIRMRRTSESPADIGAYHIERLALRNRGAVGPFADGEFTILSEAGTIATSQLSARRYVVNPSASRSKRRPQVSCRLRCGT